MAIVQQVFFEWRPSCFFQECYEIALRVVNVLILLLTFVEGMYNTNQICSCNTNSASWTIFLFGKFRPIVHALHVKCDSRHVTAVLFILPTTAVIFIVPTCYSCAIHTVCLFPLWTLRMRQSGRAFRADRSLCGSCRRWKSHGAVTGWLVDWSDDWQIH